MRMREKSEERYVRSENQNASHAICEAFILVPTAGFELAT